MTTTETTLMEKMMLMEEIIGQVIESVLTMVMLKWFKPDLWIMPQIIQLEVKLQFHIQVVSYKLFF